LRRTAAGRRVDRACCEEVVVKFRISLAVEEDGRTVASCGHDVELSADAGFVTDDGYWLLVREVALAVVFASESVFEQLAHERALAGGCPERAARWLREGVTPVGGA